MQRINAVRKSSTLEQSNDRCVMAPAPVGPCSRARRFLFFARHLSPPPQSFSSGRNFQQMDAVLETRKAACLTRATEKTLQPVTASEPDVDHAMGSCIVLLPQGTFTPQLNTTNRPPPCQHDGDPWRHYQLRLSGSSASWRVSHETMVGFTWLGSRGETLSHTVSSKACSRLQDAEMHCSWLAHQVVALRSARELDLQMMAIYATSVIAKMAVSRPALSGGDPSTTLGFVT